MPNRRTRRIPEAFSVLIRYPGRTVLTVLGLTIGIGAFIAMVGFGKGARASVLAQFEVFGVDIIKVTAMQAQQVAGRGARPLTDADVAALRREATTAVRVMPVARRQFDVAHGGAHDPAAVFGTLPGYSELHRWPLAAGGMYDETDIAQRAKVCVLGAEPAGRLFGQDDPLGETVTVGGRLPCRVIGVLARKGHSTAGSNLDDVVLVPVTTFNAYLGDESGYYYIEIEPTERALVDQAILEVQAALRRSHGLGPHDVDDFTVSSPFEVVRAVDRTAKILGVLLQGIAAISLLVGGIGIMNIQLVSVAERRAEIGIRAAIGASPRQILTQFLLEAVVLSAVGATLGVSLGYGVASAVASRMQWPRVLDVWEVLFAAGFGVGVGLVFGYLPARRAAQLDPIVALRRE